MPLVSLGPRIRDTLSSITDFPAAVVKMKAFIVGSLLAAAVSAIPMPEPTPVSYLGPSML
jgi:hypothetical protein